MKRLFKSKSSKMICGVCGGIGEYFNIDPNVIRILMVILSPTFSTVIAYIVAAVLMPEA